MNTSTIDFVNGCLSGIFEYGPALTLKESQYRDLDSRNFATLSPETSTAIWVIIL